MLYNNCSQSDSLRLESIQRKAAVICTGAINRTETCKLMAELNWDSLSLRRTYAKLCLLFKIICKLTPLYLGQKYIQAVTVTRVLRINANSTHRLVYPMCRIVCYQQSFFPSTVKLWNALPNDIAQCNSISLFKTSWGTRRCPGK